MAVILSGEKSREFELALADKDYTFSFHAFLIHNLIQRIFLGFDEQVQISDHFVWQSLDEWNLSEKLHRHLILLLLYLVQHHSVILLVDDGEYGVFGGGYGGLAAHNFVRVAGIYSEG